jgi:hypothetical protein
MTSALLFVFVLGVLVLALVTDLVVVLSWPRRRWR